MIRRLNHAVLFVRDAERAAEFYCGVLGFEVSQGSPRAYFLRCAGSNNDHDLGLFSLGPDAPLPDGPRVGLYHLAWQVDTIDDLAHAREALGQAGALVGESDHHVSKSLYAKDPDGNEFEVMWAVPRADWTQESGTVRLDLPAAIERWSGVATLTEANPT